MLEKKIRELEFRPSVLGDQVANIIAQAIMDNELEGGQKLIEAEIQKQFGVSRSPIREAFRTLEKKGLVDIIPRRGTFVRKVTADDIRKTYPIRAVLEGLAAREAHARIASEDISRMEAALSSMEECFNRNDMQNYWKQHLVFHEVFIHASCNEVLIDILSNIRMSTHRFTFSRQYYQYHFRENMNVHREIFSLFADRGSDPSRLEDLVRTHIEESSEKFISYLQQE